MIQLDIRSGEKNWTKKSDSDSQCC